MWKATAVTLMAVCLRAAPAGAQAPVRLDTIRLAQPVHYDLAIGVDFERERIDGTARVTVRNPHDRALGEASFLLYRLMTVSAVRDARGRPVPYRQAVVAFEDQTKRQATHLRVPLVPALAPGAERTIEITWGGHLLGYAETGMSYVRDRVDSAYTLIREDADAYPTVGWPSRAVNRRAGLPMYDYVARITAPSSHVVANVGRLVARREREGRTIWTYRSVKPSWRMDFAIARFGTIAQGDRRVFHLAADSSGARRVLAAMDRTLALYARWFGPLRGDPTFTVIEVPDGWGSQADEAGMLQAAAAFRDPRREYEVYHELSHLWNVPSTDAHPPRWNEGLATFLEDVTTDSLYRRATTDANALQLAKWLAGLAPRDSLLRTVPPVEYGRHDATGYSYQVGALMFYALYRAAGHEAFARIMGEYYRRHGIAGGSTADFVAVATRESPVRLDRLFADWLYTTRWTEVVSRTTVADDLVSPYREATLGARP